MIQDSIVAREDEGGNNPSGSGALRSDRRPPPKPEHSSNMYHHQTNQNTKPHIPTHIYGTYGGKQALNTPSPPNHLPKADETHQPLQSTKY